MANIANKVPYLKIISTRGFVAQTLPKTASVGQFETTTLPNKLVVAAAESPLPVARVSVLYRAGSKNETYDSLGASHLLRISGGLSTKGSTAFGVVRNIQQIGGNLKVSSDREVVAYTLEVTADKLETGLRYLQDVATRPAFKPWELSDSIPRIRTDIAAVPDQVRAVELAHKAAFRTGLGNSVFCPKHQIGKLSSETLQHYFASNCTTNRCAVVGVGIDMRALSGFAQNLGIESGPGKDVQSKYHGGEIRKDRSGNLAHIAVFGEGGSWASPKEAVAFAILQQAAGVEPVAKRGNNNGALGKVVSSAVGDTPCCFHSLNASYLDGGVFGFVLSTDSRVAGKAVEAAVKAMKSGSISGDSVNRGKSLLKAALLHERNSGCGLLTDMGNQAVLLGQVSTTDEMLALIDSVTPSDVSSAASKMGRSKLSMGAIGNLVTVPYVSDLA